MRTAAAPADRSADATVEMGAHPFEGLVGGATLALVIGAVVLGGDTGPTAEVVARLVVAAAAAAVAGASSWSRDAGRPDGSRALTAGVGLVVLGSAVELASPYERSLGAASAFNPGFVLLGLGAGCWATVLVGLRWRRHEEEVTRPVLVLAGTLVGLGMVLSGLAQPLLLDRGGLGSGGLGTGRAADEGSTQGGGGIGGGGLLQGLAEERPDGLLGSLLGGGTTSGTGDPSTDPADGEPSTGLGEGGLKSLLSELGLGDRAGGIARRITTALSTLGLFSLVIWGVSIAAAAVLLLRRFRFPTGGLALFVAASLLPLAVAAGPWTALGTALLAGGGAELTWRWAGAWTGRRPVVVRRLAVALIPAIVAVAVLVVGRGRLGLDLPPRQLAAPVLYSLIGGLAVAALILPPRSTAGQHGDALLRAVNEPHDLNDPDGPTRADDTTRRSPRW